MPKIEKVKVTTTLNKLIKADACNSGLTTLINSLPKGFSDEKQINLLHILNSNGLNHFFWAWRASNITKGTQRKILHDIVLLVQTIYEKQYPGSSVIKDVLKALSTGRNLQAAADAADTAAYAAYAADAVDAVDAAYAAAYAAYAAFNAAYAAHAADYAASNAATNQKIIKIIKTYLK